MSNCSEHIHTAFPQQTHLLYGQIHSMPSSTGQINCLPSNLYPKTLLAFCFEFCTSCLCNSPLRPVLLMSFYEGSGQRHHDASPLPTVWNEAISAPWPTFDMRDCCSGREASRVRANGPCWTRACSCNSFLWLNYIIDIKTTYYDVLQCCCLSMKVVCKVTQSCSTGSCSLYPAGTLAISEVSDLLGPRGNQRAR